jgi:organic radical activating enzyme
VLKEIKKVTPTLYVYWTITDFCNFACAYCPPNLHSGDHHHGRKMGYPSNAEIDVFLDRLVNVHKGDRFLQVCLSGGEPTLHPMYGEIIHRLKPHAILETVTNGSRDIKWWQALESLPDKVTMSLHAGFSKMDRINVLGEYLLDNGCDVSFNMMCDPIHWETVKHLYDELTGRLKKQVNGKILTDHTGGINDGKPYDYEESQLTYIREKKSGWSGIMRRFDEVDRKVFAYNEDGTSYNLVNPFELVTTNQHQLEGWSCTAGNSGIRVNFDGNAYAGICSIRKLGRIDKFDLLQENIICTKRYCKTAVDLQLDKFNPQAVQVAS